MLVPESRGPGHRTGSGSIVNRRGNPLSIREKGGKTGNSTVELPCAREKKKEKESREPFRGKKGDPFF